jgi:hypothetical protein
MAQLFLKNGDRFNYDNGHVSAFYAHDAFFKFPKEGNPADFMGKINATTNAAITLCEQAIRNLGYSEPLRQPIINIRDYQSTNEFTRYIFHWWKSPDPNSEIANFEVDMENKTIKSVYCDDPSLWHDPPKINVPMTHAPLK